MAKSMTGFGSGTIVEDGKEISIELKSLNHRYTDINIRIPRNLSFLEDDIRKKIQAQVFRGHIDVFINYQNTNEDSHDIKIDFALLKSYLNSFEQIKKTTNLVDDITLSQILKLDDILIVSIREENNDTLTKIMRNSLEKALCGLIRMRSDEGEKLVHDIDQRADFINSKVSKIEDRVPIVIQEYKEKLQARIYELLQGMEMDMNRFNTEVAFFSDRSNITEEIIRLRSHIKQLQDTLSLTIPIGRKLDFIVQEMNREINTIGSKASDLNITNIVMDIKSEIEKIREQIQNIE